MILFSSCHLIAQDRKNDPEWKVIYDSLIKHYHSRNADSVIYYAEELFTTTNQPHDSLKVNVGAMVARFKKNESEAFHFLNLTEATLLKSSKNRNLLGWNYYYKATWYYNNSFDKKALKYYYKADSVFTAINRKSFISVMTKNGICDVLMESLLNDKPLLINQVIPYIDDGLKVSDSIGFKVPSSILLYKKGDVYFTKNDLETSEYYYRKSLEISVEINNNIRQSLIFNRLAKIFLRRKLLDSAIVYQEKAVEKAKTINNFKVISVVNLELGKLYNKIENYVDAVNHLDYAKEMLGKSKSARKEFYHDIDYNLAEAYFGKNEFKKGYRYLKSAKEIMEEVQQIKNIEKIEEIELKFQSEKKEQEIALLKSQNELVAKQKTNQRNQLLGVISITSIAGLFFFFLYRNRKKTTKKLQELDKAKSNFFSNVSHEFRTPLTLISGPIQQQLKKKDLSNEDRSNLEMMQRNSDRLLTLVDQLLGASKIESGQVTLHVSKNNVITFAESLIDNFRFTTKQKLLKFEITTEPTIVETWFDKDLIEKIITNLLSNAVKYTPENGKITCKAVVKNNEFHFEIKNAGEQLTVEEVAKLFDRFYQVDQHVEGTGIGLSFVKEIVKLHQGTITATSVENWITFKVILPITKADYKDINIEESSENKKTEEGIVTSNMIEAKNDFDDDTPILLIVEDNADVRMYVDSIFKSNYKIIHAENGQGGIDLAIQHIPDIIISDIMMPIKNGIELCNTLKTDERTSHIPIILLTAKAGEENEIKGIKTGADDYITKPFNHELLKLKVENLLASIKKLQERFSQEVILKPTEISISSTDDLFLNRLQDVLDDKLVESTFNTDDFCKSINMSRMQLHRKLKALFNMTTTEFIRSQRLKLAADLLKTSDVTVSQVGYSVGFNDPAYFSKRFKEVYNCTPTQYAKRAN
ncbi:response regulator [uncultured Kordia sp.]|uniref:response regulator n=1 Tax=uncultured Kordia sp. TaxID=507699 RepID=UPI002602F1B5|nr:response regulator [uncultured Kordia sp.]